MVGIRRIYGGKSNVVSKGWAVEKIAISIQQSAFSP
jgi:hypothetical protein